MNINKLDMTKFFDPESALDQAEKHYKSCTGFIADKTFREATETITSASFNLIRAQVAAYRVWEDTVQKSWQS